MQEGGRCEGRETPRGRRRGAGKLRGNLQAENEDSLLPEREGEIGVQIKLFNEDTRGFRKEMQRF